VVGQRDNGAMQADDRARAAMVDDVIRRAIDDELLVMHYQPRVRVLDSAIVGFEALMRLRTSQGELLAPQQFLARADELAMLESFEHKALRDVCRQTAQWNARGYDLKASLNVSAQRMHDVAAFEPVVTSVLEQTHLSPDRLTLEVSEITFVDVSDETVQGMNRLVDLGIDISVDDFGAGLASTTYLERLPIREIKIDRSFTAATPHDRNASAVVRAYGTLAREMDVRCVAEGVETAQQHAFLVATGIELAQGYYYERPLPAASFYELIREPTRVVDGQG